MSRVSLKAAGRLLILLLLVSVLCSCGKKNTEVSTEETDMNTITGQSIAPEETSEAEMEEQIIISKYQEVQQAMIDKDIKTLDEIILDDTIFRHMSGKTQTKEEYFADIENGRLSYQSYTMSDAKVVIDGDDATLTAKVTLTANAYGAQGSWPFNVTAHFVKIDGEWHMTN